MACRAAYVLSPSAIVVGETILVALLQFAIFAAVIRITSEEIVGVWILVNSLLGFSRAADFWSRGLSSFVAQARGDGYTARASSYAATAVASAAAGYLALAALGYAVLYLFAERLVGADQAETVRGILPIMVVTFWLMSVGGTLSLAFLGFERPGIKAGLTVCGTALFLILVLVLAPAYGLRGLLVAQAAQAVAVLSCGLLIWHRTVLRPFGGRVRRDLLRDLVSFGSKALSLGLLQSVIEPATRLIVNAFGGVSAVALVELAARLIGVVRNLILSPGQILVPAFARLGAAEDDALGLHRSAQERFLILGIALFAGLVAAGPLVSTVILGRMDTTFLVMLWILSAGWVTNVLVAPCYFLLMAKRTIRPLFQTHAVMALGVLGLGWLGGVAGGLSGATGGISVALVLSSVQLRIAARRTLPRHDRAAPPIGLRVALPPAVALVSTLAALAATTGEGTGHATGALIWLVPILCTGAALAATVPVSLILAPGPLTMKSASR